MLQLHQRDRDNHGLGACRIRHVLRRGPRSVAGGQALAEAWGKNVKTGNPFFWSEKELDHADKLEVLVGAINGRSKIRFLVDHGDAQQYTDYGVIAIDTAVRPAVLNDGASGPFEHQPEIFKWLQ